MIDKQFSSPAMSAAALEWTRRRLLRATTGGAIGLGLGRQAMQRAAAQELPTCNFNLQVFSKKIGTTGISGFFCEECQCEGNPSFLVNFKADFVMEMDPVCDETDPLIPSGSTFQVSVLHFLRRYGPAGAPNGFFAIDPGVQLLDPSGTPLAQIDQLEGTLGFDSQEGGSLRCEVFPQGAGFLKMTGLEGTRLERCTVVATFYTIVDLDPTDLCLPWTGWTLLADGILSCDFCPAP
jgi:hypothetical protein